MQGAQYCIPNAQVFDGTAVPVASAQFVLNSVIDPHNHEFFEILFVISGYGIHRTSSGERPLQRGNVFVFQPGAWHGFDACQQLKVYNCYFARELLSRELAWIHAEPGLSALVGTSSQPIPDSSTECALQTQLSETSLRQSQLHLETMRHISRQRSAVGHAQLMGHLLLLLGQVAQTLPCNVETPASPNHVNSHAAVVEAMRLMESRLDYTWSLSELSGRLHMDRSYLIRLFTAHTGMSPMAHLAYQRALHAAQLLTSTDLPIASIAKAVGWPDPNYFARRFKAHFGVSARAYRTHP